MIKIAFITQLIWCMILVNCFKMHSKGQNNEITMLLSVQGNDTSFEKTVNLVVTIKNNSKKDIWVLDFQDFSTDDNSFFQLIIEKDGHSMISPSNLLRKRRVPNTSDYKKLKPTETLSFNYELNFTSLVDDYKNIGTNKMNVDYGEYVIQIHFNDDFLIKKDALKSLTSNKIKLNYLSK